jgi:hydrogenase maturation protease
MHDLGEQLQECFHGRVCLMGLGNVGYGDDGFGAILSETILRRLKRRGDVTGRHDVINAQTVPERFITPVSVKGFNHLIFIDAVEFGGVPGSVIFMGSEEMAGRFPQISTHKISTALLARWIEAGGTAKAWLLGVQPGSLKPSKGLTKDVQVTLDILEEILCELWVQGDCTGQQE